MTAQLLGLTNRSVIAIVLMILASLLLATFPGWHVEVNSSGSDVDVKPFPSKPISQLVCVLLIGSSFVLFVATLWQHSAAVIVAAMMPRFTSPALTTHVSPIAVALEWLAWALVSVAAIQISVIIVTIYNVLAGADRYSDAGTRDTELMERTSSYRSSSS